MSKASKDKNRLDELILAERFEIILFLLFNEVEINGIFSQHFVNLQFNIRYIYLLY